MKKLRDVGLSFDRVIRELGLLGGILITLNGVFVTYEIIRRYVFNSPTIWVFEVTIYVVIASTFLAFAYVLIEKAHVKVDFITNHLSPRTATLLEIVTSFLAILFCLVLVWESGKMALAAFKSGEISPSVLRVPMFIPESFVPIGSFFLTVQFIRYLRNLFIDLANSKSPKGEESTVDPLSNLGLTIMEALVSAIFVAVLALSLYLLKVNLYLGLSLLFFVLLFSGIPVAFALGLFGVFGIYCLFGGAPMLMQVPVVAYSTLDSPIVVALPLFVLTANVLKDGEVGVKIFRFANTLVRHLPGGLGIASVVFCCLFAAMTGSSVAVAAAASLIALPEMLSRGYSRKFTIGLLAAGGTLGICFPPSLPLMLYGAMTTESVGLLFMATLIPGLILSGMFILYVALAAGRDENISRESRASFKEIIATAKEASGGLFTIVIIMGGIYTGIFTPTESGGVAAVYSIILCLFVYRTLSWKGLKKSILDTVRINSMILLIVIGANIAGQTISMSQIPDNLLSVIKSSGVPPWMIILFINIFLIILGGPLEAITILVTTLPILYPLVTGLGFNGLWFAVIMVINMELALISPPEGLNLFILQNLAKSTASEVSWGVLPFLVIIGIFLALISLVPSLTTWLPALVMKSGM